MNVFSVVLCGLMLPALCSAVTDKEKFQTTTKYVDFNGESLTYSNTRGIEILLNEKLPQAVSIITKKYPANDQKINALLRSIIKLANVSAFQAYAVSSVDNGNGTYTAKQFLMLDKNAKSIFIDPAAVNKPLDWLSLPADTRLAVKGNINFGNAWSLIKKEINSTHPIYRETAIVFQNPMVSEIFENLNGDFELLLTGTTVDHLGFKVVLPDPSGKISALVKQNLGHMVKNGKIEIPVNPKLNISILFSKGKIVAVSSPELLAPQGKKLGSQPLYQKYAKILPKNGTGYAVFDLPQEFLTDLEQKLKLMPEIRDLIKVFLKPVSAVSVSTAEKDGCLTVSASNFSFAQVQQMSAVLGPFAGSASSLLPALVKARERARVTNCLNHLKQLGLGVHMYAADHDDKLPADLKAIVKQAYIQPAVLKNLIYVGPYNTTRLNQIKTPSRYVIAVCNRLDHKGNLCVLYLDGHVETHKPGALSTADYLKKTYQLNQEDYNRIVKRLSEAGK